MTAEIQSRRRLGLTATLVREDSRDGDVSSLIDPKRFDAPWRDIEAQGWIARPAAPRCGSPWPTRSAWPTPWPSPRSATRGATARSKLAVVAVLAEEAVRRGEPTLVIGQYLYQQL